MILAHGGTLVSAARCRLVKDAPSRRRSSHGKTKTRTPTSKTSSPDKEASEGVVSRHPASKTSSRHGAASKEAVVSRKTAEPRNDEAAGQPAGASRTVKPKGRSHGERKDPPRPLRGHAKRHLLRREKDSRDAAEDGEGSPIG